MKTILIVDDDAQLRTMFSMALSRGDYRVLEAESGSSGLTMARQYLPDLILSDIHMPGGDGTTLLREIRHDPELRAKQVVLMTGRSDMITPRQGMEDGADDFLVKPVGLKALLSCVEARFSRAAINWRVEDRTVVQLRSWIPAQLPHEFFTPLAGIIGLMDVVRSNPALSAEDMKDIHDDVYESALRLHRTLRNYLLLLDLQSPTSDVVSSLPLDKIRKSIQSGVDEALRLNKRSEDITIILAECSIALKPEDLSRMVEELVDNACKFSRHGTPITITLTSDNKFVVADKGRGMTLEEINRIGAFQQFDRKKYEQQGLGLGLVLVQKFVAIYKAEILIESQLGEGTQVTISFLKDGSKAIDCSNK